MTNDFSIIYQDGMTPRMLAQTVLEDIYGKDSPLIPIDPFKLMRMYGIVYQFMEFKDLEGIYLMPEDEKDVAIVGINKKRPITRQLFSAAHAELYDYVLGTQDKLTIYKILDINRMLFQFAPFPEESGKTRTDNNLVLGTKFETVDWTQVAMELYKLQVPVEDLMAHANDLTISEYVLECMKIHHRITQIHPFRDGNGRSSRALLNWMLRLKGLPPIYFKTTDKESYYKALEKADQDGDYTELLRVTIRELYRTITRTMIDAEPQ